MSVARGDEAAHSIITKSDVHKYMSVISLTIPVTEQYIMMFDKTNDRLGRLGQIYSFLFDELP